MATRKNKLSKYPFARIEVDGTFEIDKTNLSSMKIALGAYNTRHDEHIAIDYAENEPGRILVKRIA